jgi:hypothetical protein
MRSEVLKAAVMRSEVLKAAVMNIAILWDVAPCSLYVNHCFGGTHHLRWTVRIPTTRYCIPEDDNI